MKKILIVAVIVFLKLNICNAQEPSTQNENYLSILQDNKEYRLKETVNFLNLNRKPFSIQFDVRQYEPEKNKHYAIRIAATTNAEDVSYIQEGPIEQTNKFFSSGTGLAGYKDHPYPVLFLNEDAHHFIYYKNETEKRAHLVTTITNKRILVNWHIDTLSIDSEKISIENSKMETIYILLFKDKNLNQIIEEDEYNVMEISLN